MKYKLVFAFLYLFCTLSVQSQIDTSVSKLTFLADFRFRIEQDWNSQKSDGSFRSDRSRMRIRARGGFSYSLNQSMSLGFLMHTGNPINQQDPQISLGLGSQEFGSLLFGLERAFFKFENEDYALWLGKNNWSFQKKQ